MTLIKTQTGNSRHLPHKYSCPYCGQVLSINKRFFWTVCSKCKKGIKGDDLVEIKD